MLWPVKKIYYQFLFEDHAPLDISQTKRVGYHLKVTCYLNVRKWPPYLPPCLIFVPSQWTEEDEIADYKKNRDWMDECVDGMFEKWYDKIDEEGSMEDRRKVEWTRTYSSLILNP